MEGKEWTDRHDEINNFAAHLGSVTSGHLVFMSDIARLTILNNPSISELARGSFEHHLPGVRVEEGTITIQYRNFSLPSQLVPTQVSFGQVTLNPSVPWEIEFRGGISGLNADLRKLALRSLDLLGGASRILLLLSKPAQTTFIYIMGGLRNSRIRVPPMVGLRVQISDGVNHLVFAKQRFEAIGGRTILENSNFKRITNRYDICIAGGASNVTIDE